MEAEDRTKELEDEIESRKDDYSRLEDTLEHEFNAKLNRIAEKLHVTYIDFLDAKDMKMTTELGENLRDELDEVFKTLIKSGIKVNY